MAAKPAQDSRVPLPAGDLPTPVLALREVECRLAGGLEGIEISRNACMTLSVRMGGSEGNKEARAFGPRLG